MMRVTEAISKPITIFGGIKKSLREKKFVNNNNNNDDNNDDNYTNRIHESSGIIILILIISGWKNHLFKFVGLLCANADREERDGVKTKSLCLYLAVAYIVDSFEYVRRSLVWWWKKIMPIGFISDAWHNVVCWSKGNWYTQQTTGLALIHQHNIITITNLELNIVDLYRTRIAWLFAGFVNWFRYQYGIFTFYIITHKRYWFSLSYFYERKYDTKFYWHLIIYWFSCENRILRYIYNSIVSQKCSLWIRQKYVLHSINISLKIVKNILDFYFTHCANHTFARSNILR